MCHRVNPPALRPVSRMITLLLCSLVACGGTDVLLPDTPSAAPSPPTVAALGAGSSAAALQVAAGRLDDPLAGVADRLNGPLGSDGRLLVAGLQAPPAATPWPDTAIRRFHVDSRLGRDSNDGRSAARAWRSLARLATAPLAPGDRVELACDSIWRETLRLRSSGMASAPIVVAAPAAGCSQLPTIDGSVELPAARWVRQSTGVWRQPFTSVPLQLFSAAGHWVDAHHPNRSASGPTWLSMATDGNLSTANGRDVSTRLSAGADLVLPTATRLGPGTRVRVRTAAFVIDDLPVASTDGRVLNLAVPSTYPLKAGWGYLLTGQAWMVDSPGEWFHDAASRRLLAAPLGSSTPPQLPASATVLPLGIDLQGRSHVVIDGLAVRKVGTGALLRGGLSLQLRNSRFEDIADRGIDAADSQAVALESNRLERTGLDAVFAGGIGAEAAQGLVVRNNLVRQSGVLIDGTAIRSLPRRSYGAVLAGQSATVSGNVIVDSGYIGIRVFERSVVDGNVVIGSCTVLDDCGAIYTLGAGNGSRITGNVVLAVRGNPGGKPGAAQGSQAQGLYLDDNASGVQVEGNTVIDADHGVQLHDASANSRDGQPPVRQPRGPAVAAGDEPRRADRQPGDRQPGGTRAPVVAQPCGPDRAAAGERLRPVRPQPLVRRGAGRHRHRGHLGPQPRPVDAGLVHQSRTGVSQRRRCRRQRQQRPRPCGLRDQRRQPGAQRRRSQRQRGLVALECRRCPDNCSAGAARPAPACATPVVRRRDCCRHPTSRSSRVAGTA
jgi:hypothetical protein